MAEDTAFSVLGLSLWRRPRSVAQGMLRPARDGIFRDARHRRGDDRQVRPGAARPSRGGGGNAWRTLREDGVVDAIVERGSSRAGPARLRSWSTTRPMRVTAAVDERGWSHAVRGTDRVRALVS